MDSLPANDTSASHRIVAVTGGRYVPSRRFRIKAIVPHVRKLGIQLDELCPVVSSYPPSRKIYRPAWFAGALTERLTFVLRSRGYDAVILQRELISTLATVENLLPGPRVLDVDDAIFLYRNGKAAKRIASSCALVVCGNEYLVENFSRWNRNVAAIPTGVDTDRLRPRTGTADEGALTIGWIGTVSNFRYLEQIKPALASVLKAHKAARFRIVSSERPGFLCDLGDKFEFVRWYPGIEETEIPGFSIGIMPLEDNEWSRGKCAFKMLQYMAAGIPVVASKVGMNRKLLAQAEVGVGVESIDTWADALDHVMSDAGLRRRCGKNGRKIAVEEYSLTRIAAMWKHELERIL
jgi:glycosyltransferase involved in cell wall biosynthesis